MRSTALSFIGFDFRSVRRLCLLAALAALGGFAVAEDLATLSLEQLLATPVTGAAKRAQKPTEAPSMVSIVTADEIRRFGWRTLDEALGALRGVHITYDRSYAYVGLRGLGRPGDYNNRVLMLIDGVPINDGIYDQAPVGSDFPLDLALVERIEYVPGPGSVLYGGNAFFGVFNVITRAAAGLGTEFETSAGSGREFGLRLSHGRRTEAGDDWLVSASRTARRGRDLFFESYAAPGANAWSRGLDHQDDSRVFARFARGGFTASLAAGERGKGLPGGPYGADLDDPRNAERERRILASLQYERQVHADWSYALQGFAGRYRYGGTWAYAGETEPDQLENRWLGGEFRVKSTALPRQMLVAGLAWRRDGTRHQFNRSLDVNTPRQTIGIFVQDDWTISEHLWLSAGVRHDHYEGSGGNVSPRLALIAQPQPETTIKLISGRAFRPPNAFETDYAFAGSNLPNPALQPERIRSDELGVEQQIGGHLHLAGSLYRNRISQLVALEIDPATGFQQHHNVGSATARGLEIELRGGWRDFSLRASTAWQDVRHDSGAVVANTPRRLAKLLWSTVLPGDLRLAGETHYLGRRTTDSGDVRTAGDVVGGHAVTHLALSSAPRNGFSWGLRITNLFDRRYAHVAGTEFSAAFPGAMIAPMPLILQDERAWQAQLTWRH